MDINAVTVFTAQHSCWTNHCVCQYTLLLFCSVSYVSFESNSSQGFKPKLGESRYIVSFSTPPSSKTPQLPNSFAETTVEIQMFSSHVNYCVLNKIEMYFIFRLSFSSWNPFYLFSSDSIGNVYLWSNKDMMLTTPPSFVLASPPIWIKSWNQ